MNDYGSIYSNYSILNSGLGSRGNDNDNFCVTDGSFTNDVYTPHHCNSNWASTTGECCLRRRPLADNSPSGLFSNAQIANLITSNAVYGSDGTFSTGIRSQIEGVPHGSARMLIYIFYKIFFFNYGINSVCCYLVNRLYIRCMWRWSFRKYYFLT